MNLNKLIYNFKSSILNISDSDSIENILYGYYPDKEQEDSLEHSEYNKHDSQDGMVDSILQEVKYSADLLEEEMQHQNGYRHGSDNGKIHEVVETVVRLEELEEEGTDENDFLADESGKHESEDGPHLVLFVAKLRTDNFYDVKNFMSVPATQRSGGAGLPHQSIPPLY